MTSKKRQPGATAAAVRGIIAAMTGDAPATPAPAPDTLPPSRLAGFTSKPPASGKPAKARGASRDAIRRMARGDW